MRIRKYYSSMDYMTAMMFVEFCVIRLFNSILKATLINRKWNTLSGWAMG